MSAAQMTTLPNGVRLWHAQRWGVDGLAVEARHYGRCFPLFCEALRFVRDMGRGAA